ncbi:MAG: methylated-DNA--[protein]-cysteine S-methyltransferase [Sphaerobacter sp.]|nr:methylated-DNA--[protein]-cysteine S-methyltransferase [Sphaerobacter sp.]
MWVAAGTRGLRVVTVPGRTREECLREALRHGQDVPIVDGGPLVEQAREELTAYFEGRLQRFTVPLDPVGTAFQRRVWAEVAAIPYGETATYRQIAERIGNPRAVRAVGAANGANPLAIIIPCHRVVGSDGSLTGYGGGLAVKRALLDLEARCRAARP